jgi:hypothetical protein
MDLPQIVFLQYLGLLPAEFRGGLPATALIVVKAAPSEF